MQVSSKLPFPSCALAGRQQQELTVKVSANNCPFSNANLPNGDYKTQCTVRTIDPTSCTLTASGCGGLMTTYTLALPSCRPDFISPIVEYGQLLCEREAPCATQPSHLDGP